MTEMDATDAMDAMTAQFADAALPFSDPEGAAARATAEPMAMYVQRATRSPVERLEDDYVVLLRMADILYVNKHHDVEQASKYLGSSRPAIPLGLIGGYALSGVVVRSMASSSMHVPLVVEASTYAFAVVIFAAAALASALVVRRRLDALDLVAVLKARE